MRFLLRLLLISLFILVSSLPLSCVSKISYFSMLLNKSIYLLTKSFNNKKGGNCIDLFLWSFFDNQ